MLDSGFEKRGGTVFSGAVSSSFTKCLKVATRATMITTRADHTQDLLVLTSLYRYATVVFAFPLELTFLNELELKPAMASCNFPYRVILISYTHV